MSLELADACLRAGELDAALEALDAHLADHPDDQEARRLRVDVLLRLPGRVGDALAELDRLDSDDPLLRYQVLEALGEHDMAFTVIEGAFGQFSLAQYGQLLMRLLYARAEPEKALRLLENLPKTWLWLGWSGDFLAQRGDFSLALEHYCSALTDLQRTPKNPLGETQRAYLLLKRAETYRRLRRWPHAEADYRAAALIIPNDPTITFNQGLAIYEGGELRRALPLCRDALDHAPEALRDSMRAVLTTEPRYKTLAQALLL